MTFDEWFAVMPHPAMSPEEIAEMRRDYKYAWDAALKHARPEGARSESGEAFLGENDYREALIYASMTMKDLAAGKPVKDLDEQLSWIGHLLDSPQPQTRLSQEEK